MITLNLFKMENLIKIQNELKVPKTNVNAFGKYKYRSAEDILEAVKPILLKYEAQLLLSDRVQLIGAKCFLQATATLYFKGAKVDGLPLVFETQGFAELAEHKGMSAEQATGTASSYARKYALNGLFLIDETEQDADSQKQPENKPTLEYAQNNLKDALTIEELRSRYNALPPDLKAKTLELSKELAIKLTPKK